MSDMIAHRVLYLQTQSSVRINIKQHSKYCSNCKQICTVCIMYVQEIEHATGHSAHSNFLCKVGQFDNNADVLCVPASWLCPYCGLVPVYVCCCNNYTDFCFLTTKWSKGICGHAFVQFVCRQVAEGMPWAVVRQACRPVERRRGLSPSSCRCRVPGAGIACCCAASLYTPADKQYSISRSIATRDVYALIPLNVSTVIELLCFSARNPFT